MLHNHTKGGQDEGQEDQLEERLKFLCTAARGASLVVCAASVRCTGDGAAALRDDAYVRLADRAIPVCVGGKVFLVDDEASGSREPIG